MAAHRRPVSERQIQLSRAFNSKRSFDDLLSRPTIQALRRVRDGSLPPGDAATNVILYRVTGEKDTDGARTCARPYRMGQLHLLELHGEIDISRRSYIERELRQIEAFGPDAITIVDLDNVPYLDTTFLNALVRTRNRLRTWRPADCILLAAPRTSMIRLLFEITDLDKAFPLFDDAVAARRSALRVNMG